MENLCRNSLVTMIDGEVKTCEKVIRAVLLINELWRRYHVLMLEKEKEKYLYQIYLDELPEDQVFLL